MISRRVKELLDKPSQIVKYASIASQDLFSKANPRGYLNFGVAENHLVEDLVADRFDGHKLKNSSLHHYNKTFGMDELRESYVQFLHFFLKTPKLSADNVIVASGATCILEILSYCMFDEGDKVGVAAPYYLGFDHDLSLRFKVDLLPIFDPSVTNIITFLSNTRVKAFLLTSPSNPQGKTYSEKEIKEITDFCIERKIHLISDEVYALTEINENKFCSVLKDYSSSDFVHHVYSMAKDFALSGQKVGFLYSSNAQILEACQFISYFYTPSTLVQDFCKELLSDQNFIEDYVRENISRIKNALELLRRDLPPWVKFDEPDGGFFLYLDFGTLAKKLEITSDEGLFDYIFNKIKISMLPGSFFHDNRKFFFRLCFTHKDEELEELCRRLKDLPGL